MDWQKITGLEVGHKRYADGEWRIVGDELETRMEIRSNGKKDTFRVTSATQPDGYQTIAELGIKGLNSASRIENRYLLEPTRRAVGGHIA